jgi:WD40 repeat protein
MPINEETVEFLREVERWYSSGNALIASSPNSELVAIGSIGGVSIVNTVTGETIRTPPLAIGAIEPLSLRFSPDGSLLASIVRLANDEAQLRTHIYLWQTSDASLIRVLQPPLERWPFRGIGFTSASNTLITATATGTYVYSASSAKILRSLQAANDLCVQPGTDNVLTVAGIRLNLLDTQESTVLQSISHPEDGRAYMNCSYSPDGRYLAATDYGGFYEEEATAVTNLHMWDVTENRLLFSTEVFRSNSRGPRSSISFSPDGKLLLVSTRGFGYSPVPMRIIKADDGTEIASLQPADYAIFSPDGRGILASSLGIVSVLTLAPENTPTSDRPLFGGGDLIRHLNSISFREGHEISRDDGVLSITNGHDNSWIASPTLFPNFPLPSGFTLKLNMSGRAISLWGKMGYFTDRQKYPEWWQGINVVHIGQWDDEALHLTFYDGLSSESYDVTLPISAGTDFSLRFPDAQGKELEVLDAQGRQVFHLDVVTMRSVHFPNGLFADRRLVIGTHVGPGEQLTLSQLGIRYLAGP